MQISFPERVACRLLTAAGRTPENHTILQENVTTLLAQFKPDFVESLEALPGDKLLEGLNGSYANGPVHLALKLSRDIRQKPYDDQAVLSRLESLEAKLQTSAREVVEGSAGYPCSFYVVGSLLRGRFGANSDLDLLCQASPQWMESHRWTTDHDNVSLQYMDTKPEDRQDFIDAFGPSRSVTMEEMAQPGFLLSLYRQGVESKGYTLEHGHLKATAPTILRELETPPEASKRIMWSLPMV